MPHIQSQIKGGYYPLPPEHLPALASLFKPGGEGGRILDPVAGEGDALKHLSEAWNLTPYANELDIARAEACRAKFGPQRSVQGDIMTLRTPNQAYSVIYVNPPYAENTGGADEKRREFEMLGHAFKWAQDGAYAIWVVYAHHMTERAASFLCKHSSSVDVYRLRGLHLDTYPQIVVVARVRPAVKGEIVDEQALKLVTACKLPDTLPELVVFEEPRYKLPAPRKVTPFYFRPDEVTAGLMLPALLTGGTQRSNPFQEVVETPPPPPELAPIVPPRSGQVGMILAAGLFNGLLLNREDGPAAVRGVVRMAEINTTPPEMVGIRETIEHKAQVTITLLSRSGKVTRIESHDKDRLVAFIQSHRQAFLDHLEQHSKPLYQFDHSRYRTVFDRVFRNRKLPGRPVTGLFETQKHVAAAMLTTLEKRRRIILVGDMGVGKTPLAGTVIAGLWAEKKFKPGQVAVVLAPPHLIEKWKSELIDVIPGCVPHIADKDPASGDTLVDDVAAFMRRAEQDPEHLHILVLSRERAKLAEGWQPSYQVQKRRFVQWPKSGPIPAQFLEDDKVTLRKGVTRIVTEEVPICPTCATPVSSAQSGEGKTDPLKWMQTKPHKCHACGGALWQFKRTFSAPAPGHKFPKRNPRYPIASLLRERYGNRVAVAVCDEVHENKSAATDQGRAMQNLVHIADYAIGMTGTLMGGTASSVFWLEWAFNNQRMVRDYPLTDGIEPAINRWVRTMGVMVKVIEYKQDEQSGTYNGTDRHEHKPEEAPGISPLLIRSLIDHCIWVGLPDLAFALPEYREIPMAVNLPPDIQAHYDREKRKLLDYLLGCKEEGDASFLGAYLQACLRYPTTCYDAKPIIHRTPHRTPEGQQITHLVTTLQGFGQDRVYPKEQALLDLLKEELAANRPCVVFIAQSGKVQIQERLVKLIKAHVPGAKSVVLESDTVATDKRDGWVKQQVQKGCNLLMCNPKLVETGLDLLWAKTLIFFEVHYSLYTVSQASRRHWRIGQTDECKVVHLFYDATMEAQAIQLVSEKQAAAALLGGDADGGGLAQLSGGSSSLEAELAKSIASDEALVDVSKLFQQSAKTSADFTSGWATGNVTDESALQVVPLDNLIGKRFYHQNEAHLVVDYGPLDQATYQVKNLVNGAVAMMDVAPVVKARAIAADLPLSIQPVTKPAPAKPATVMLPRVPELAGYHAAKAKDARVIALVERGSYFYAYGTDAETVARTLNGVLDMLMLNGQRVPRTAIPGKDIDHYAQRLAKAGLRVAAIRQKMVKPTVLPKQEVHVLPATLGDAYVRFRETRQQGHLTFVEMPDTFVSFEEDAISASQRLHLPSRVHAAPGGPSIRYLSLKKGEHEPAFERLRKGECAVALSNGHVEVLPPIPVPKSTKPSLPAKRSPERLRAESQGQLAFF